MYLVTQLKSNQIKLKQNELRQQAQSHHMTTQCRVATTQQQTTFQKNKDELLIKNH